MEKANFKVTGQSIEFARLLSQIEETHEELKRLTAVFVPMGSDKATFEEYYKFWEQWLSKMIICDLKGESYDGLFPK